MLRLALCLGFALVVSDARAAVIMVLQPGSPTPNGSGGFTYTYDASLATDQQLQSGDYFAIIDFNGYIAGSVFSSNPDIIATTEMTTTPPPFQAFPDDATIPNLLFTYTGPPLTGNISDLGNFGADSTLGVGSSLLVQTASAHKEQVQNSGNFDLIAGNSTLVQGPSPATAVPEPSTLALVASGLVGLFGIAWNRRRASIA